MKRKNKMRMGGLFTFLMALAFNCFAGVFGAQAIGCDPMAGMALTNGIATAVPFAARTYAYYNGLSMNGGTYLYAGVIKELWLDIIMENFFVTGDFMDGARDLTSFAEYGILHAAQAGVYPTVYKNNTSWPLTPVQRTDTTIDIPMDTLITQPTFITKVEEMQSAYDKMSSITADHQKALQVYAYDNASYNWAPVSNTAFTPVNSTTGTLTAGARLFTIQDLANMQKQFNLMKAPKNDRVAVLHPQHIADLTAADAILFKQFVNLKTGDPLDLCGFKVYSYPDMPVYNATTGVKTAYQAASASTDSPAASFFFCNSEVFKAMNAFDMFTQFGVPSYGGDLINFQMRFLALPVRNKAIGAIFSATS